MARAKAAIEAEFMDAFRSGERKGLAARPDLARSDADGLANRKSGYPYHGNYAEYIDTGTPGTEAGYSPKDEVLHMKVGANSTVIVLFRPVKGYVLMLSAAMPPRARFRTCIST